MRRRKDCKCLFALLLAVCILLAGPTYTSSAKEVVPSKEECTLSFKGVTDVFFGSAKEVNAKKGTEVYLTYTVDKVREDNKTIQHGVIATDQVDLAYPYTEGGVISYSEDAPLLKQGYTYFIKFTYTENGFEYVVAASNDESSEWVFFDFTIGEATDDYTNFGVWLSGGEVSARLTHVRCYDQDGNNLGIYAPKHKETLLDGAKERSKDTKIDHKYNISIKKGTNVVISNAKETTADTIYMEYTVKESKKTKIYQTGLLNHHAPLKKYPHDGAGYLLYEMDPENPGQLYLLQEGASYIITFQRKAEQFLTLIQRTYKGKTEFYEFINAVGDYIQKDPFVALWFGDGPEYLVNCKLTNFKCYDSNLNNLGVQTNDEMNAVKITHQGEMEDYSGCEAMYYDAENNNVIALYANKSAKVTRDGKTEKIAYKIKDDVLTLEFDNKVETYDYFYQQFVDEKGNLYVRLGEYIVDFVTETDEEISAITVNAKSGYTITSPDDPKKDGAEFMGWYLSDGTKFDFDSIINESKTLYAKWSDDPEFVKTTGAGGGLKDVTPIIAIVASLIVLAIGVVCGTRVLKNGAKKGKANEKEKTNE